MFFNRKYFLFAMVFLLLKTMNGLVFAQDDLEKSVKGGAPWEAFRFGFSAYKKGDKEQAVRSYRDAAELGQLAATWKLAHMYAHGDGIAQDHFKAYQLFLQVTNKEVEPGSRDESYVADSLARIGRYLMDGIPESSLKENPSVAREYFKKSAVYGSAIGQFEVGKMYLSDKNVSPFHYKQAARWFKLAAQKGHQGARAVLGNLLFHKGKVIDGLAMMTAALARASVSDQLWIRELQEEAFAITQESQRVEAVNKAEIMLMSDASD